MTMVNSDLKVLIRMISVTVVISAGHLPPPAIRPGDSACLALPISPYHDHGGPGNSNQGASPGYRTPRPLAQATGPLSHKAHKDKLPQRQQNLRQRLLNAGPSPTLSSAV